MMNFLTKIELCIFDVDGVLVNTKLLHYPATMLALKDYGYFYSLEEDESFGTIPTKEKLKILANQEKIKQEDIEIIWSLKDDYASELFDNKIIINSEIKSIFQYLKNLEIKVALASNARYSFLYKVIDKLEIKPYVDLVLSAQSVTPKPDPEIYLNVMKHFNISSENTLIFEDSEVGKKSAYASKANVYEVNQYDELKLKLFKSYENNLTSREPLRS